MSRRAQVIMLPGAVLPPELAFEALREVLGDQATVVTKALEVYAGEEPPAGYALALEVAGILRVAGEHGFDRFHLVGYSAGGASSLLFASLHPDRLRSLALLEPAWAGNSGLGPAERAMRERHERIMELPAEEMLPAFVRSGLAAGVEPPPPQGPMPPWMAKRPAGLRALTDAFRVADLDLEALRRFRPPVYFALGGRSNPDSYGALADRLAGTFADFTLEVFADRHHFDPPHRTEPERLGRSLHGLWARAQA